MACMFAPAPMRLQLAHLSLALHYCKDGVWFSRWRPQLLRVLLLSKPEALQLLQPPILLDFWLLLLQDWHSIVGNSGSGACRLSRLAARRFALQWLCWLLLRWLLLLWLLSETLC
jgi:hypothetical protein